jgi:hypothetical protein
MSTEVEFIYKPQGQVLEEYILSEARRTMIMGPLGSGKTNASCWKGFRINNMQRPDSNGVRKARGLAIRNTYSELFSTTIKDWLDCFEDLGKFNQGGMDLPTHRMEYDLEDGTSVSAEVMFAALDREADVKKLRGFQGTWIWVNEIKEVPFAVVEMADLRVGRYPKDVRPRGYCIFGDTNAPDNDHWYYRMAEELKPTGWNFLRQPGGLSRKGPTSPWRPNPKAENVKNLPPDYYIEGAQGKTEAWILVNLANEYGFVADGMPVYPDYVDSTHCREFELIPGLDIHIGLDFGLTPAAQFAQRTVMGQWRIHTELCTTDTGVSRFAGALKKHIAENYPGFNIGSITGDPAGDQRQAGDNEERNVFQLLEANGIKAVPAPFNNDFTIRTEAVTGTLRRMIDGEPGYLIHPQCVVSRKGMQGGYKFRRIKVAGDDRYEDKPVKNKYSHPCEAGQYLLLGGGEGDKVIQATSHENDDDVRKYRERMGLSDH